VAAAFLALQFARNEGVWNGVNNVLSNWIRIWVALKEEELK
jgi:hypothetical protein